jgi:lipopolysaccharide export system protein LptA
MSPGPLHPKRTWLLAGTLLLAMPLNAADELPAELGIQFDPTAPISLEAASSEFDRRNDRLSFTQLSIRQGEVQITADRALATRLDFEDSTWTFRGNVVIESPTTRAWSDTAQVHFLQHRLDSARLTGAPARFEQRQSNQEKITQGRAAVMDYELSTNLIRLQDDAWVSDGANEVSGPRIAYDLNRDFIIADGDNSGQVRMKITPSERDGS